MNPSFSDTEILDWIETNPHHFHYNYWTRCWNGQALGQDFPTLRAAVLSVLCAPVTLPGNALNPPPQSPEYIASLLKPSEFLIGRNGPLR